MWQGQEKDTLELHEGSKEHVDVSKEQKGLAKTLQASLKTIGLKKRYFFVPGARFVILMALCKPRNARFARLLVFGSSFVKIISSALQNVLCIGTTFS